MDPCQGVSGDITQYWISFQSGSVVVTESVSLARCTAGRCSYTFEPPSNPPSSYDSVSVAAENVVGVGAARRCITQPIRKLQFAINFVVLYLDNMLQFLKWPNSCIRSLYINVCHKVTSPIRCIVLLYIKDIGLDRKWVLQCWCLGIHCS